MSRTHRGSRTGSVASTSDKFFGLHAGNYVTLRLINTLAVANNDSKVLHDRIVLMQPFRISHVSVDALSQTATTTVFISGGDPTGTETDATAGIVVSSGTPKRVTTGSLVGTVSNVDTRNIPAGGSLDLRISADGTGAAAKGTIIAHVTGYFLDHISKVAPFAERGQSRSQSPCAGYYDNFAFLNLRQNANQAARAEVNMLAPYAGRVMAIVFDGRGLTVTTGAITADFQKNSVSMLSAALDADVNLNNATFVVDAASTPNLTADSGGTPPTTLPRTFAKGDTLSLVLASGALDVVPVGGISAQVLVWCQGHVRDANAEPTTED